MTKQLVRGTGLGGGIGSVLYSEDSDEQNREFFAYNAIGSVVALTNSNGAIIQATDYEAFGSVAASSGSSLENRLFCTKERDASTGLDYFGFRYYDPELGRFLNRDPSGYPDGPNNYLYCHNNPINHIDPLGLFWGYLNDAYGAAVRKTSSYIGSKLMDSGLPGGKALGNSAVYAGEIGGAAFGAIAGTDPIKRGVDNAISAKKHFDISKATGSSTAGAAVQAYSGVQNENIPLAMPFLEAYDAKSYHSGNYNDDLDLLERGGKVAQGVATCAGGSAMALNALGIDVSLTGSRSKPELANNPADDMAVKAEKNVASGKGSIPQKLQGDVGEAAVRARLENSKVVDVVGEQIRIVTPEGVRYTDFLVRGKKVGRLRVIEVKTGNATRDASQLLKDSQMADPLVDTFFKGRRGRAAGIPDGTRTGSLRTYEVNANRLNR